MSTAPASPQKTQLTARYAVPGPRYTSYPTALHFSEQFGNAEYETLWRETAAPGTPLSLYVHIPFCENLCYYCACNKIVTRNREKAARYLDYLTREIALQANLAGKNRPVTQLHWGGGTPTFLGSAELTELMYALARHFSLGDHPEREYSIELDPRVTDSDTLALLRGLGFNRLSFGIQDFDENVQRAINRVQPQAHVAALLDSARALGFTSIGFDLIYGLPRQSPDSLRQTLRRVIELAPDRIAFYNYGHLPDRFPAQRFIDKLTLPDARGKLEMLALANESFSAAGYRHIGLDHFVRPRDALALAQDQRRLWRNFQGYSTSHTADLMGLGVSAIGNTAFGYAQNTRRLPEYYRRLDRNELPVARGLRLSDDDRLRRHVILEILCNLELDFASFEQRFGTRFEDYFRSERDKLDQLVADELITISSESLRVTAAGQLLLRNIGMAFDHYLSPASNPHYSRAI